MTLTPNMNHDVYYLWSGSKDLVVIELRSEAPGTWSYREVPLHEGVVIIVFLDTFVTSLYDTVESADWYHEDGPLKAIPLGFSSEEDFHAFVDCYPDVLSCADSVLHWLNGEASLVDFIAFYLDNSNDS